MKPLALLLSASFVLTATTPSAAVPQHTRYSTLTITALPVTRTVYHNPHPTGNGGNANNISLSLSLTLSYPTTINLPATQTPHPGFPANATLISPPDPLARRWAR